MSGPGAPIQRSINLAPSNFFLFCAGTWTLSQEGEPTFLIPGCGPVALPAGVAAIASPRPGVLKSIEVFFGVPPTFTLLTDSFTISAYVNGALTQLSGTIVPTPPVPPPQLGPKVFRVTLPSTGIPLPTTSPQVATLDIIEIGIIQVGGDPMLPGSNITAILELE